MTKRAKPGRKKLPENETAKQISFYAPGLHIEALGGKHAARQIALDAVMSAIPSPKTKKKAQ